MGPVTEGRSERKAWKEGGGTGRAEGQKVGTECVNLSPLCSARKVGQMPFSVSLILTFT